MWKRMAVALLGGMTVFGASVAEAALVLGPATTAAAMSDSLIEAARANRLKEAGFLLYAFQIRAADELQAFPEQAGLRWGGWKGFAAGWVCTAAKATMRGDRDAAGGRDAAWDRGVSTLRD